MHLRKPGSRVSLLPARRGRTRRGPKPRPCGGAAALRVSFHDKHFHRRSRTLFICSSDSPAAVFVGGGAQRQRRKGNNIHGERVTCVIIASLPSSSVSFPFKSAPKRLRTHCGRLFQRISRRPVFRHDPISPRSVLIFDGWSLLCFILRRAFSLSPCPSLLLLKRVISPSHHQRTSKTAHRHFF